MEVQEIGQGVTGVWRSSFIERDRRVKYAVCKLDPDRGVNMHTSHSISGSKHRDMDENRVHIY